MTKPIKLIVRLAVALVLLVIVGVILTLIFINSIAKKGIEAGGSYALGVPTTLDKASIGVFSGKFGLAGLNVDNPQGFKGKFLSLGDGKVEVSLPSLMGDTVSVGKFSLDKVEVDLEKGASGSNYQIILDNLKKLDSGQKPAQKDNKPGKKFKITEVSITNVKVHLDLLGGPAGMSKVDIPIAEIKLSNVGSDGSGVDIPKLTSILLEAILTAAVEKGGGLIPADISGDLKAGLNQLSGLGKYGLEAAGKAGEQLGKIGSGLGKAAEDAGKGAVDAVKEGLGGLLPGSKKGGK